MTMPLANALVRALWVDLAWLLFGLGKRVIAGWFETQS